MAKRHNRQPLIVLLTDFGLEDYYVGTMKGVIKNICPEASIIDLSHAISRFSIESAAFLLEASFTYFPVGTVFCAVVDPGVGSCREAICAFDGTCFFVAPNNGLLSRVKKLSGKSWQVVEILNGDLCLVNKSKTFHGRDVFSPVAAHIASGVALKKLGRPLKEFIELKQKSVSVSKDNRIAGQVIHIDSFGNLVTNFHRRDRKNLPAKLADEKNWQLKIKKITIKGISQTFSSRKIGSLLCYWGSAGYLEIATNQGNAAKKMKAKIGTGFKIWT